MRKKDKRIGAKVRARDDKYSWNQGRKDKENYSGVWGKLCNREQLHMSKEKVQGKVACNIEAFCEYNHLERTLQGHKGTSSRRKMRANHFYESDVYVLGRKHTVMNVHDYDG